jgi:hypothetical protein
MLSGEEKHEFLNVAQVDRQEAIFSARRDGIVKSCSGNVYIDEAIKQAMIVPKRNRRNTFYEYIGQFAQRS